MVAMRPELLPDGITGIEWQFSSGLMSHEIWSPRIFDTVTGETILDLLGADWDGGIDTQPDGSFLLHLRRYSSAGQLTVRIHRATQSFQFGSTGGAAEPLSTIDRRIREEFKRIRPVSPPAQPKAPTNWILLGVLAAMGLLAVIAFWK